MKICKFFAFYIIVIYTATTANAQGLAQSSGDSVLLKKLVTDGKSLETSDPGKALKLYQRAKQIVNNEKDSKYSLVYNTIGYYYTTLGNYDSSLFYFKHAYDFATRNAQHVEIISALKGISQVLLRKSQFDSSRYCLSEALQISKEHKDFKAEAEVYNALGNVSIQENKFPEALNEYIASANLYDSVVHDTQGYCTTLFNIGNVHSILNNSQKAIHYTRQGQRLAQQYNFEKGIAYGNKLLGRIYRKIQKPDSAIICYENALHDYEKTGDQHSVTELYLSIGNIYYDRENYNTALLYYDRGLTLAKKIDLPSERAYLYSSKGFACYALHDYDRALTFLDSSRVAAKEVNNAYLMMDSYEVASNVYEEKKDFAKALQYHKLFTQLKDSLTLAENKHTVDELESKYESSKKQSMIELLQKDQRISRISTYGLIALLIMVLLSAFLFVNRSRLKIQTAKELTLKQRQINVQQKELYEAELRAKSFEEERLKQALEFKNKELTTYTLNLIQKNEVLEELKATLENIDKTNSPAVKSVLQKLNYSSYLDKEWNGFKRYFEQVHKGFFENLVTQYPDLTASELKLCALLKLNLETKEISSLLGISPESVKVSRSRLRKKLNLETEQNLAVFMAALK